MSTAVFYQGRELLVWNGHRTVIDLGAIGREKVIEWVVRWMLDRGATEVRDEYGHMHQLGDIARVLRDDDPDLIAFHAP